MGDRDPQLRLLEVAGDAALADRLARRRRARRAGSGLKAVEERRMRARAKAPAAAVKDPGALEPCAWCQPRPGQPPHEPGRCPTGGDRLDD